LFQRQLRAHHCASRGADDKIGGPKIDSLTRETIHQTSLPSPTYGSAAAKHESPRKANCAATFAIYSFLWGVLCTAAVGSNTPQALDSG